MTTTGDPRQTDQGELVDRAADGRFAGDVHGVSCDCCIRGFGEINHDMGFQTDWSAPDQADATELMEPGAFASSVEFAAPDAGAAGAAAADGDDDGDGVSAGMASSAADLPNGRMSVTRRRFIQGLAAAGAVGYVVVREAKPVERSGVESQVAGGSASTGTEVVAPPPEADQLQ
ncbi:MAG: twin-arginine translocation signal domain-containing protein, partial [Actinomycetota bacterium]